MPSGYRFPARSWPCRLNCRWLYLRDFSSRRILLRLLSSLPSVSVPSGKFPGFRSEWKKVLFFFLPVLFSALYFLYTAPEFHLPVSPRSPFAAHQEFLSWKLSLPFLPEISQRFLSSFCCFLLDQYIPAVFP